MAGKTVAGAFPVLLSEIGTKLEAGNDSFRKTFRSGRH